MTEFLTENVRRAYPLARTWDDGAGGAWSRMLVDASVSASAGHPSAQTSALSLLSASKTNAGVTFTVGFPGGDSLPVVIAPSDLTSAFPTVFTRSSSLTAFLTVSASAVEAVLASSPASQTVSVSVPFSLRCTSYANRRVTAVSAYAAPLCTTPVFAGVEYETPVRTVTGGDVILGAADGTDVERATQAPLSGDLLRVSAISAPAETSDADTSVDLMLRGDACFTVETLPGTKAVDDGSGQLVPVARTASEPDGKGVLGGGVIRLGQKCKPCCQCEDYRDAAEVLHREDAGVLTTKGLLDAAYAQYAAALAAFTAYKTAAEAAVNTYANVHVSATGVPSGGVYTGSSTSSGLRKRVAITLTVANMTRQTLSVSAASGGLFTVPGFSPVSLSWRTAGQRPSSGTSIPRVSPNWSLGPGDTLAVVGTYAATGTDNEASVPAGSTASVLMALPGKQQALKEVTVK